MSLFRFVGPCLVFALGPPTLGTSGERSESGERCPGKPNHAILPCADARQESGNVPEGLTAGEWTSIREAYEAGRHAAIPLEDGYRARNPGQQWVTHFDGRGFTTTPDAGGWTWGLELSSYGFPGAERSVAGQTRVQAKGSLVAYEWDATLEEWYENDQRGLEHGYVVRERPPRSDGPEQALIFTLAVRGGLEPEVLADGRGARFVDEHGAAVLTYAGLVARDAEGRDLPARLEGIDEGLRLVVDERGARYPLWIDPIAQQAYLKASNTGADDEFGSSLSISGDTVVVGARKDDSNATGVNGDGSDNSFQDAGAAYVFVRNGTTWTQQAYLKASNTGVDDMFGNSVSVSGDTAVVGAWLEDSSATGVNGNQSNNGAMNSGAVHVFVRNGATWTQQAYLKASNTGADDQFGFTVSVSGDTVVVGTRWEDSNATGVDGDQDNDLAPDSGAAYVFVRSGTTWTQQAYLKASNTDAGDYFGASVSLSGDTAVVGAWREASNATGVDGDQGNDLALEAGASYVFVRSGTTWTQQAYLKASNTEEDDDFGFSVSVSGDTVVVGAQHENSNATGVNGNQSDETEPDSGAAYVFVRTGTTWTQQAYLKASNTRESDHFGISVSVLGNTVVVGAIDEDSNATGVNGDQGNNGSSNSGAAYVFVRSGTAWGQQAYLKASNTDDIDHFGSSVSVSGDTVVVGAHLEDSNATGVNGNQGNDDAMDSGAAYVFTLTTTWTGATDSDWTDDTNWTDVVPDPTWTAIVPDAATTANDPVISVGGQTCHGLWIEPGGTLDISAGMDSLGVFGGAILEGPITGTGQLVFEEPGTLAGSATIGLTFDPAVRTDADLTFQGGPLTVTGTLSGDAVAPDTVDLIVLGGAVVNVGTDLETDGDLSLDGTLTLTGSLGVDGGLIDDGSGTGTLSIGSGGGGLEVRVGGVCYHGNVLTARPLDVENRTVGGTTNFEVENGWPADVTIDVDGQANLLTATLVLGGDLVLVEGTFSVAVDGGTIKVNDQIGTSGIVVQDGAIFDVTGVQTTVLNQAPVTVQSGGKLNVGAGGVLELVGGTLTVAGGGTLCLDGLPGDSATLTGQSGNRYTLALLTGSTLAAKNFAFELMSAAGIVVPADADLGAPPLDLRAGTFDHPDTNGVLLDIVRPAPTELRYLRFDNSLAATGVKNVKTSLASSAITLVNWSGDLATDATVAESFDDDPGEGSPPERIVWAPPQASDVQGFSASWGTGLVQTSWQTLAEVDSEAFVVQRSLEPPGIFTTAGEKPSVGPSSYTFLDHAASMFAAWRYRLYERLTHGELRLVGEVMLPATGMVLHTGGSTPAPPMTPQPLVVGPGGPYPDVRAALRGLARRGQRDPVTLELVKGLHDPFELGRGLRFDVCIVAQPGAVIGCAIEPVRIEGLAAQRSVELIGLVLDARRAFHPALVIEDAAGVVLLQDAEVRGSASGPKLQLTNARAVALQGGAIEGELVLERGSRATASGVRMGSFELRGRSVLETRGERGPRAARGEGRGPGWSPAFPADVEVEPGSRWLRHPAAPLLRVEDGVATLEAGGPGLAWLGVAQRLGFQVRAQPLLEGVLLLEPSELAGIGRVRSLAGGRASWQLGTLPPGECIYLQGLAFDPLSGRVCLSDVVRLER